MYVCVYVCMWIYKDAELVSLFVYPSPISKKPSRQKPLLPSASMFSSNFRYNLIKVAICLN